MIRGPVDSGNAGIGWSVPCAAAEEKIASGAKSAPAIAVRRCLEVAFVIRKSIAPCCHDIVPRHTAVDNRIEVVDKNRHVKPLPTSKSAAQRAFKPSARSRVQSGHPGD